MSYSKASLAKISFLNFINFALTIGILLLALNFNLWEGYTYFLSFISLNLNINYYIAFYLKG